MDYTQFSKDETLSLLNTNEAGLTDDEARSRLLKNGRNELVKAAKKSLPARFADQIVNPMILVLLAAAAVSVFITVFEGGSFSEFAEAGVILAVVILNSVLGVTQESKADKAIEALQEMNASTVKVRRGGIVGEIPASELVTGDIVLIEAGDVIPADMRLIRCASLRIEEASLTGESVPVDKHCDALLDSDSGEGSAARVTPSGCEGMLSDGESTLSGGDSGAARVTPSSAESAVTANLSEPSATPRLPGVPLGDRANMAYMGTSAVYGRGEGVVTTTGMDTELGKIAGIIQSAQDGETPLQKRLSQLSRILSVLILCICAVIFAIRLITSAQINFKVITESFMLAISLAVAAIPEGLVAVVTIVLSIGVSRMAKRNAIIRRLTAVETLGCAQVICTDKTGTLTQNKMTVTESCGDIEALAAAMALCCDSQLTPTGDILGDPTENALISFAITRGLYKDDLERRYPRVAEAPFDSVRKMMTTIHDTPAGSQPPLAEQSAQAAQAAQVTTAAETACNEMPLHDTPAGSQPRHRYIQYTKGAPDEVLRACAYALCDGKTVTLSGEKIREIEAQNKEYADDALRVLAAAYRELDAIPDDCSPAALEKGLTFIGLAAMTDPVRPEAKAAVEECSRAGIKVVMITGDHKDTAAAIARQLGIISRPEQAITGQELEKLDDAHFQVRITDIFAYARVQPEHKVRIVNMWKQIGCITAMTGDGVNDAPAVKCGDIGVGMGIAGTDVTKNVADMVLADDNFATIVAAVAEGRRIYDNIKKTLQFLLASNFSEVISVLAATTLGFTLFRPVHLLFINLITDTLPAVALGMEHAQPGIMDRPPRGQNESIFSDGLGFSIAYQGVVIALLTLASYFIVSIWDAHEAAMTSAFLTLSMCEIFHAFALRSLKESVFTLKTQNKVLWGTMALSLALALLVIYVPFLAETFSLIPLSIRELAVSLVLSVIIVPVVEAVKACQRFLRRASLTRLEED